MTTLFPPLQPTDILVAVTWIATIPGFTAAMAGATLPPDTDEDEHGRPRPAPWLKTGFVTVTPAGGGPDPYLPRHEPVLGIDCWASVPGSSSPPWNKAEALGEAIWAATMQRTGFNRPLTPLVSGVAYPTAVVQSAYLTNGFKRLYSDAADYARVTANLALSWVTPSFQIP